ncbi:hypothetical protein COOONC_28056 [Cooperia oncophora]
MEDVPIPKGKCLRYRCGFQECRCDRHFSIVSVVEHLASHFAKTNGNRHYHYRCCSCGMHFFNLSMTASCQCKTKKDGRLQSVRKDLSLAAVRHDIFFASYCKLYIIPVLVDDDPRNNHHVPGPESSRRSSKVATPQPGSRTPAPNGSRTPRKPREEDDLNDSHGRSRTDSPTLFLVGHIMAGEHTTRGDRAQGRDSESLLCALSLC